jgi:copper(I)-binding protein
MLFDPTRVVKAGELIKVTFVFAEREPIDVSFEVKDVIPVAGSSGSPETMDHSKMDHGSMDHGTMNHGDKKP